MIHTMAIIMNNIHYINIYYKLKYGIFIDSSITVTCYLKNIQLIKMGFARVNSDDYLHI